MNTPSIKIVISCILSSLLLMGMGALGASIPVSDRLVEFTPETKLESSPSCQGIQLTKTLIGTSPLCAQRMREQLGYRAIRAITWQGEPVGEISSGALINPQLGTNMLLPLAEDEDHNPDHFPLLYEETGLPENTFVYTLSEETLPIKQSAILTPDPDNSAVFLISSGSELSPGTAVFDQQERLVCLVSSPHGQECHKLKALPKTDGGEDLSDYDYDYDDSGISTGEVLGIAAGVTVVAAATTTGLFYLGSYIKASSKGMPSNVFWNGILSLKYCSHCNTASAVLAIVGTVLFPFTVCAPICLCPAAAYVAAANWINDYTGGNINSEHQPIVDTQPQHY